MKFSVSLAQFQKSLQKTLPAIPPKSTLPVLEHLNFSLEGNNLRMIATDQDITIMSNLEVNGMENGSVLVPGRRLNEIVRALGSAGEIEFSAKTDTYEIKLKTSSGKYGMKGINPDEYLELPELFESERPNPNLEPGEDKKAARFTKDKIMWLANKTAFATSSDEFRPSMTGVLFQFRGDRLNAVATDSYRLAKAVARDSEEGYPEEMDVILPSRSVELLRKVDSDVIMSVIETNGKITHVRFDLDSTVFITRIIDEKFPPYESVIPSETQLQATLDKDEFLAAIKRVAIFTSSVSKQVRMSLEENAIRIFGEDEESGSKASEEVACDYSGEKIDIGFNYKFLEEAFSAIESADEEGSKVVIEFTDPTRPAMVKPGAGNEDLLMLVMPVRLS
ncbi:MAG: DNA polymerase III subunit beta [Candidatus Kapaibacterium sp.]